MFVVIWDFVVRPEHAPAFVLAYGPRGDWARLFRGCDGFVECELLCDAEAPEHYMTLDYWREPEDYVRGMASVATAYQELDARCAEFTSSERRVGNFVKP